MLLPAILILALAAGPAFTIRAIRNEKSKALEIDDAVPTKSGDLEFGSSNTMRNVFVGPVIIQPEINVRQVVVDGKKYNSLISPRNHSNHKPSTTSQGSFWKEKPTQASGRNTMRNVFAVGPVIIQPEINVRQVEVNGEKYNSIISSRNHSNHKPSTTPQRSFWKEKPTQASLELTKSENIHPKLLQQCCSDEQNNDRNKKEDKIHHLVDVMQWFNNLSKVRKGQFGRENSSKSTKMIDRVIAVMNELEATVKKDNEHVRPSISTDGEKKLDSKLDQKQEAVKLDSNHKVIKNYDDKKVHSHQQKINQKTFNREQEAVKLHSYHKLMKNYDDKKAHSHQQKINQKTFNRKQEAVKLDSYHKLMKNNDDKKAHSHKKENKIHHLVDVMQWFNNLSKVRKGQFGKENSSKSTKMIDRIIAVMNELEATVKKDNEHVRPSISTDGEKKLDSKLDQKQEAVKLDSYHKVIKNYDDKKVHSHQQKINRKTFNQKQEAVKLDSYHKVIKNYDDKKAHSHQQKINKKTFNRKQEAVKLHSYHKLMKNYDDKKAHSHQQKINQKTFNRKQEAVKLDSYHKLMKNNDDKKAHSHKKENKIHHLVDVMQWFNNISKVIKVQFGRENSSKSTKMIDRIIAVMNKLEATVKKDNEHVRPSISTDGEKKQDSKLDQKQEAVKLDSYHKVIKNYDDKKVHSHQQKINRKTFKNEKMRIRRSVPNVNLDSELEFITGLPILKRDKRFKIENNRPVFIPVKTIGRILTGKYSTSTMENVEGYEDISKDVVNFSNKFPPSPANKLVSKYDSAPRLQQPSREIQELKDLHKIDEISILHDSIKVQKNIDEINSDYAKQKGFDDRMTTGDDQISKHSGRIQK